MTASPSTFSSHISGVTGTLNGSASNTTRIWSVARIKVSVPPIAIRLVEAKKAVPFCKAAVTCESTMRTSRLSSSSIQRSR